MHKSIMARAAVPSSGLARNLNLLPARAGHPRLQEGLVLPRKEVQQETFLELRGKESPRQAIQAGPHLKPPGNFANRSHPGVQGPLAAVG